MPDRNAIPSRAATRVALEMFGDGPLLPIMVEEAQTIIAIVIDELRQEAERQPLTRAREDMRAMISRLENLS